MELMHTDNDALDIDALGSFYAPNDKKIVVSMKTIRGKPHPDGYGIPGAGKEMYDPTGATDANG